MAKAVSKGVASGSTSSTSTTTSPPTSGWTKSVPAISASTSKNQEIDGVLSGVKWNTMDGLDWTNLTKTAQGTISFSFPDHWTDYGKTYGSNEHRKNFGSFKTAQEQTAFYNVLAGIGVIATENLQASFQYISAVTSLRFEEFGEYDQPNDGAAVLRFGKTDMKNAEAWAYYPSSRSEGGDAWFSNQYMNFSDMRVGTYDYVVLMHEVGHALGLKHSFENTSYGLVPIDSLSYTVMSYSSYPGGDNWYGGTPYDFPQTLMMYDIAALQHMYGANWNANAGATTYTWNELDNRLSIQEGTADPRFFDPEGTRVYQTLWDGNGIDTYNLAVFTSNLTIDLRPGEWVNFNNHQLADIDGAKGSLLAPGNVANALTVKTYDAAGNVVAEDLRSLIENAIGGRGNDTFIANQTQNSLTGNGSGIDVNDLDVFVWKSLADLTNGSALDDWDVIQGFEVGFDRIDLNALAGFSKADSGFDGTFLIVRSAPDAELGRIKVVAADGDYSLNWFA